MNKFIVIGLIIEVVYVILNRFVVKIPAKIAIPVLMVCIAFMGIGLAQMKQQGII